MTVTASPVIVVNGKEYPGPTLDDLSFDEFEIAERFGAPMPEEGAEPDLRQMRWLKALVVIALTRAGEDAGRAGELRVQDVEFRGYERADAGPPPNRAARRAAAAAKPGKPKR